MVNFIKMHGTSNDFVIIDCRTNDVSQDINYKKIANRRTGIGCDQIILISKSDAADCFMHIYNADGSKVEMCGNAARCVAFLIMQENNTSTATIELSDRILQCMKVANNKVQVNIGKPKFDWQDIPLIKEYDTLKLPIEFAMLRNPISTNIGNTHTVFFVDEIKNVPLDKLGPLVENHEMFPNKTNVGIAQIISKNHIALRVWERGTGETSSCGSGACAALVAAAKLGYTEKKALVMLKGGDLLIQWDISNDIFMIGEVEYVFCGKYNNNNSNL